MNHKEIIKAMIIPITGARKIKAMVLKTGSELIALNPPKATAAPANPPISAWEEEEGMPNHQVNKFQKIADNKPAKITSSISWPCATSGFTVFAMVLATP